MTRPLTLEPLDAGGMVWAQDTVWRYHYRHSPVLARACPEGWAVRLGALGRVGCLLVGRPQATRCKPWYGSVGGVADGEYEVTRWQVLNLARVWLSPLVQPGGEFHRPEHLPGYTDRRGVFRSILASAALGLLAGCVGAGYLAKRPPVYPDEPYEVRYLLSYSDPAHHKGTIYRAAGWELYRTNGAGLQTWRTALPALTAAEHAAIRAASATCPRARRFRATRASHQPALFEVA